MSDGGGGAAPGGMPRSGSSEDGEPQVSVRARQIGGAVAGKVRAVDVASLRGFRPNICRVPDDVRKEHDGAYDPKLVSIGSFHHGNRSLASTQEIKLLFVHDLLGRGRGNSMERYAEKVLNLEVEARRQYSEAFSDEDSSDGFVEMLLVDGCFIIEFFLKRAERSVGPPLKVDIRNMSNMKHDLLLIENQIPYFVLQAIHDETEYVLPEDVFPGNEDHTFLDLALHYLFKGEFPSEYRAADGKRIYHLLHLSYLCLLQGLEQEIPDQWDPPPERLIDYLLGKLGHLASAVGQMARKIVSFLFICLLYVLAWRTTLWPTTRKNPSKKPRMVPTALELREAGVTFSVKENTRCYLDVTFEQGRLSMPRLNIQQNSSSEFRNLLALEQSCPDVGNRVTSYVVLMDNLVDTVADVAVLKRAGILESKLGCDEDVARFFNGIRFGLCFNFDDHYLLNLFKDLNDHCNQEHNRWRAKLMHDYFGNPWTILSLIAAFVLLVLTALQTFYTIIQSYR